MRHFWSLTTVWGTFLLCGGVMYFGIYKEAKPINPKGNQAWTFIRRTDAKAEAPILWPPNVKSWLIRKDPDARKDWRQEEKGMTGWDGWVASLIQWIWVRANSRRWWWTGMPGMLQFMESQRVGHNWVTELNWNHLGIAFDSTKEWVITWNTIILGYFKRCIHMKEKHWNTSDTDI